MEPEKEIRFADPDLISWVLEDHIHVWKFPALSYNFYLLTQDERAFADRFRFEDDRLRFSVARHALRYLLSKYYSVHASEIILSAEAGKKPIVISPSTFIHFNVTHSGEWILIAFARNELGIDIEKVKPDFVFGDLMEAHFSEDEKIFVANAPDPPAAFFYLWTRKEAITKAWGTGLQEDMKSIAVPPEMDSLEMKSIRWMLKSFMIADGYPATLAYADASKTIHFLDGGLLFDFRQQ